MDFPPDLLRLVCQNIKEKGQDNVQIMVVALWLTKRQTITSTTNRKSMIANVPSP